MYRFRNIFTEKSPKDMYPLVWGFHNLLPYMLVSALYSDLQWDNLEDSRDVQWYTVQIRRNFQWGNEGTVEVSKRYNVVVNVQ